MKFHEKLYELRKAAGMTQNDLAEKLNVSRQAVSRWEMGTAMPDVENLIAISDLFGVTLDELLRDNAASQTVKTEMPAPRYWDYVHEKWWLPLVLAGVSYVCIYLSTFLYAWFPRLAGTPNAEATNNLLPVIIRWVFSPMGFGMLFRVLPWVSVIFLIVAFVKWQKDKN